jgi:hypothetical protein
LRALSRCGTSWAAQCTRGMAPFPPRFPSLAREQAIEESELAQLAAERPAKRAREEEAETGRGAEGALARAKAAVEKAAGAQKQAGGHVCGHVGWTVSYGLGVRVCV